MGIEAAGIFQAGDSAEAWDTPKDSEEVLGKQRVSGISSREATIRA